VVVPTYHCHHSSYPYNSGFNSGGLLQAINNLQQQAIPMNALGDGAEHTH
jgi:hypothetical protein